MTNRDNRGRFVCGNEIARQGWIALVNRRFGGNEAICKRWWGAMGAWHYDAPYRAKGIGCMPFPGQPEEFLQVYCQRLEFSLNDVQEMRF